jgi:hypothetical protein
MRQLGFGLVSAALAAACVLMACGDDETKSSGSSNNNTTTTSAGGNDGGGGSTGDAGSGNVGAMGGGGMGNGGAGNMGGMGQGGSGGSSLDCNPDPNDTACEACLKMNCCNEITACAGDQNCTCWADCLEVSMDVMMCFGQCGAPSQTTQGLLGCGQGMCGMDCMM